MTTARTRRINALADMAKPTKKGLKLRVSLYFYPDGKGWLQSIDKGAVNHRCVSDYDLISYLSEIIGEVRERAELN